MCRRKKGVRPGNYTLVFTCSWLRGQCELSLFWIITTYPFRKKKLKNNNTSLTFLSFLVTCGVSCCQWIYMQVTIWKIIYLYGGERYEDMLDHRSYTQLKQLWNYSLNKKFRSARDSNPWSLRYQCTANWELVTFWVRSLPIIFC